MTDSLWLINARKEDMHREAFHRIAKLIALALFVGLCLIPVVLP